MPTLAKNPDVLHRYRILETFEAGIALTGAEVKSAKAGSAALKGSYALMRNGECWLVNARIAPYQYAASVGHEPERDRKLLLKKAELQSLIGKAQSAGLTLVPLSLYTQRGLIKVELGLGRGKTKMDKRDDIRKRDARRRIQKAMRRR